MRGRHPAHWIGLIVGGGILLFGLAGLLRNRELTDPGNALKLLVTALLAHDAVWAWLVAAVGAVLVRSVPRRVRPVVMGALAVSAVLTLVAIPALTGNGRLANNPSILPRDYGQGLLIALAVTWGVALVGALAALRRPPTASDRERPPRLPDGPAGW